MALLEPAKVYGPRAGISLNPAVASARKAGFAMEEASGVKFPGAESM